MFFVHHLWLSYCRKDMMSGDKGADWWQSSPIRLFFSSKQGEETCRFFCTICSTSWISLGKTPIKICCLLRFSKETPMLTILSKQRDHHYQVFRKNLQETNRDYHEKVFSTESEMNVLTNGCLRRAWGNNAFRQPRDTSVRWKLKAMKLVNLKNFHLETGRWDTHWSNNSFCSIFFLNWSTSSLFASVEGSWKRG